MSRNSPTSKQLLSILSDFDEFVEWSKKKRFGVTAADDDLLLRLGEAGEINSKRLFEDSQTYDNFRYPDYSYLLESTARLMAEDCVEAFLRLPIRIRPSILQIVMTRGSGSLAGYLEVLKLAGYPKPHIMSGGETLKSLMLATQGLAGRNTAAKISKEFKIAVHTYTGDSRVGKAPIVRATLFVLYTICGEEVIIEILKRSEEESTTLSTFEIARLTQDWENLKGYPLAWSIQNVV